MIKAIAIDDEVPALKVLQEHVEKLNFIQIEKYFTDPLEGLDYLKESNITAVFLDIKMNNISGIEMAEIIPDKILIIFTTAYSKYAVKGFDVNAIDYLLKPVSFARFLKACNKLKDAITKKDSTNTLLFRDGNNIIRIRADEIYFIEAMGNYLKIHSVKGTIMHREPMKELINALPAEFSRTHKSYIVNTQHINRIEPFQLTIDNTKIPVSPVYKNDLWIKLGIK